MTRKQDIKQFRQACKEVGLSAIDATKPVGLSMREKESSGMREHMSYGELLTWLREWAELWRAP